jgi:hypothetical protein
MRGGIRLCDEGVEQGDGFADPFAEGLEAPMLESRSRARTSLS